MSHDTDKLIRQLSLVAFLMAERRPLTARDVKQNVEGYSEMSDEAFARRFYADRAELVQLGVPLQSQRDEFTGEELYTLRSEQYFLPELDLGEDELAALLTAFHLLDGRFAYAEPLRLALQNLTLGRPGFAEAPSETARRVEVLDPDYSPEMPGRLAKLENAISKQRTIRFPYWSIGRDEERERTVNPFGLFVDNGAWYFVGEDLEDSVRKMFRVSRIRGEIRFATRRERDFRTPADFDVDSYRGRPPWQVGEIAGEARIRVAPNTAWWVERLLGGRGRLEGDVFVTEYADLGRLAAWILRQDGRALPLEPPALRREAGAALRAIRDSHKGRPAAPAPEQAAPPAEDGAGERPAGPVAPERFAVLQALLAYLLAACGESREAVVPAAELTDRFGIPHDQLGEHLSLLNLVNFGGGCYTIYAELRGAEVHVDKELYGDTFRSAPRLTPLEARAIRLALEFVGPMIAADAHTPLDRVRRKLEETFGQFELDRTPEPHVEAQEEGFIGTFAGAIGSRRLVELVYKKEEEAEETTHVVEPYHLERRLPHWYVHTWDRTRDGERSFRLDRMHSAKATRERFEPREGFDPQGFRNARTALVWFSPAVARWRLERGDARPLEDGSALAELRVGSKEWLVGEVFFHRGEAVVLEPEDLRRHVAERAAELARALRAAPAAVAG